MRTKTLLLAAAVTAAGIAALQAQSNVYSLNVVGYYNVVFPAGASESGARFKAVAMQLKPNGIANPTLNNAWTNIPAGMLAYTWAGAGFNPPSENLGDGTFETDYAVPYGTALILKNTAATPVTATFVGEVMQGTLTTSWTTGASLRGPLVPQAGGLVAVHQFPVVADAGDSVRVFNGGWSPPNEYLNAVDGWENGEPNLAVGEGIYINKISGGTTTWTRIFNVQ
jgi:hypothetical protein